MVRPVTATEQAEPGFDEVLAQLRAIVGRLESGELSLEQALAVYEDGIQLARRGQDLLASAENRVEMLVSVAGKVETVPFDQTSAALRAAARPGEAGAIDSTPPSATTKPGP